eukprot:TRINITY_DN4158_c0_g1_i1.p1 TRINITY_DN4158_c0_g1~~TRINITY_DN4158_c0_g1_i1.p1  ORF type:complete len:1108 (-),score=222.37 TRINITY_DN4158_c0_g1_i1:93-3062(-)
MAVHRIGDTLLLDRVNTFKLEKLQKEIEGSSTPKKNPAINPSREDVLFSNFLPPILKSDASGPVNSLQIVVKKDQNLPPPMSNFRRLIEWNFQDMRLLVGSNMPIFGDSKHPTISLRLREAGKPINVLTGLDYWLDNLMCNVPEIAMCFHLNGIVQNYELLKTEEIPDLSNSSFSPAVIRDTAQDMLTFLKANCTREGRTYWLFKGADEDVMKLYDLTDLCEANEYRNPFTHHVAMLLFRLAKNLSSMKKKDTTKILMLLINCLQLIDPAEGPTVFSSVHCMIADIFLTKSTEGSPRQPQNNNARSGDDKDIIDDEETSVCTVESEIEGPLPVPPPFLPLPPPVPECPYPFDPSSLYDYPERNYRAALHHLMEGVHCLLRQDAAMSQAAGLSWLLLKLSQTYLSLSSLALQASSLGTALRYLLQAAQFIDVSAFPSFPSSLKTNQAMPDPDEQKKKELEKREQIQLMVERMGDLYYEMALLLKSAGNPNSCGDLIVAFQTQLDNLNDFDVGALAAIKQVIVQPATTLFLSSTKREETSSASVCKIKLVPDLPQNMWNSIWFYEKAVNFLMDDCQEANQVAKSKPPQDTQDPNVDVKNQTNKAAKIMKFIQKIGNAKNEIGIYYMNVAGDLTKAEQVFLTGIEAFTSIRDLPNVALLFCNRGRLMRVRAQSLASSKSSSASPIKPLLPSAQSSPIHSSRGDFSASEKEFYIKALDLYSKAKIILKDRKTHAVVWDCVSKESGFALYTLGCLMFDYPPAALLSPAACKDAVQHLKDSLVHFNDVLLYGLDPQIVDNVARVHQRLSIAYEYLAISSRHGLSEAGLSERSKKQLKQLLHQYQTLAELHCSKALATFTPASCPGDFVGFHLDMAALLTHCAAPLSNVGQHVRDLTAALEQLSKIQVCYPKNEDPNRAVPQEISTQVETKLLMILQSLVRALMGKKTKNARGEDEDDKRLSIFKKMYEFAIRNRGRLSIVLPLIFPLDQTKRLHK